MSPGGGDGSHIRHTQVWVPEARTISRPWMMTWAFLAAKLVAQTLPTPSVACAARARRRSLRDLFLQQDAPAELV